MQQTELLLKFPKCITLPSWSLYIQNSIGCFLWRLKNSFRGWILLSYLVWDKVDLLFIIVFAKLPGPWLQRIPLFLPLISSQGHRDYKCLLPYLASMCSGDLNSHLWWRYSTHWAILLPNTFYFLKKEGLLTCDS